MSQHQQQPHQQQQQQEQEIAIQDLQLQLQVYELQAQQKLKKLQDLFKSKGAVDPSKMFYQDRSSLQVKFQNIINDLKQFLIKQEVAATQKLRRVFFRILDSPMILLFKVSRFQVFEIRFDGFDIQLEPMEAIQQLAESIYKNIDQYLTHSKLNQETNRIQSNNQLVKDKQQSSNQNTLTHTQLINKQYKYYQQFLTQASLNSLKDKIFILYSYLRKGSNILKKKFQNKVKIVDIFNSIDIKLTGNLIQNSQWKVIKELSILNYEIYLMQNAFDVLCFYLKVPLVQGAQQVFKQVQIIAQKAKQNSNFDIFILIFVKHHKQILQKIKHQSIQQCYYPYIQNTLISILQLWGCRLCLYKQFTILFQTLFNIYKPQHKVLEICLKHMPKLEKDDIVLLRTNFKLDLEQKHNELLSLMTKRSLEQINRFLSQIYHQSLYTLNFRQLKKTIQQIENKEGNNETSLSIIVNLLTLLNGNSSYQQFFVIFQKSFKQWNHTIDLQHGHKLIPGQFAYPSQKQNSTEETITDSIKIIKNFCVLQDLSFNKEYENLIKGNSNITKTFIQFVQFLNKSAIQDKNQKILKILLNLQTQQMIIQILNFLIRCGCATSNAGLAGTQNQSQKICQVFSKQIHFIKQSELQQKLSKSIQQIIKKHYQFLHITKCIEVFQSLKQNQNLNDSSQLIEIMMSGVHKPNRQLKFFRFFDVKVNNKENSLNDEITLEESQFLIKQAQIKNNTIQAKNLGIFKLSQFQIVTNPIQFDKILDNIFFTLDSNAKRFIQYLVQQWFKSLNSKTSEGLQFYSNCILALINRYPIAIPLFSCTRVQKQNQEQKKQHQKQKQKNQNRDQYSLRCIQLACHHLGQNNTNKALSILKQIVSTYCIRYTNGTNYIKQEINPMILKQLIQILNKIQNSQQQFESFEGKIVQLCQLTSFILQYSNIDNLKLDMIQKIINKVKFFIFAFSNNDQKSCFSSKSLQKLSLSYFSIIKIFFSKKQKDMRMVQSSLNYENYIWNQIKSYNVLSTKDRQEKMENSNIIDQTIVSPYSISREYNSQTFKISKRSQDFFNGNLKSESKENKKLIQIVQVLKAGSNQSNLGSQQNSSSSQFNSHLSSTFSSSEKIKEINLSNLKYNLRLHIGQQNIRSLQKKENLRIMQKNKKSNEAFEKNSVSNKNQQNVSIIQYYLKELQLPVVSNRVVLEYIANLLYEEQPLKEENLYLWVNCRNYQNLFINLLAIYEFAGWTFKNSSQKKQLKILNSNEKLSFIQKIQSKIINNSQQVIRKILNILGKIGYSDLWCQTNKKFENNLLPQLKSLFKNKKFQSIEETQYLALLLRTSLQNDNLQKQINQSLDNFLQRIFSTRPSSQTSLMYKVSINRELLNLIMKSLSIKNLNQISFLIHSNFNNLRLYTDQLHQGLKALNMASKNRSYNQYIQISGKQYQDQEFTGPMKLFKQNFKFWIRIQKQGYSFKRQEEIKLTLQRLANVLRKQQSSSNSSATHQEVIKIMDQYFSQIQKLQINIANRVKAFYLVTKLRDLSYQNANTIVFLNSILKKHAFTTQKILQAIDRIEIFTLLNQLMKELVLFDHNWSNFNLYQNQNENSQTLYTNIDDKMFENMITICSTRRFSHSMSKVYESCDLQFDQVLQRCFDSMKLFFTTQSGKQFILKNQSLIFPAFLNRSFIDDCGLSKKYTQRIRNGLIQISKQKCKQKLQITITDKQSLINDLLKGFRNIPKESFYNPNKIIKILYNGKSLQPQQFLQQVKLYLIKTQTLQITKESSYLIFNKYKTSQATLQEIQTLGYIISYCLFNNISIDLPLHPSITAALSFNISNIDDLLSIDFKVWQELKSVLSCSDSKTLNLNFSYLFNSLKTLEDQRVQLVDKGASKKVNNFNRDQYVDLVTCYLFYKNCQPQIFRLIKTLITIVPKDYISCLKNRQILNLFYTKSQNSQNQLKNISKNLSEKIGLVLPDVIIEQKETIQNLKDFQNIHWLTQILLDQKNSQIRKKIWQDQTNIFVITTIGKQGEIKLNNQVILIKHFENKEQMALAIKNL